MQRKVLVSTLFALVAAHTAAAQPKIRLRLSEQAVLTGEPVKVAVKTAEDGHLLVLRMDTEGRVRVMFPQDPSDADRVRGGKELDVRSRGNREAFTAHERAGTGTVLAVRAEQAFRYDAFVEHDRWSLTALTPDSVSPDPEGALLHLVDQMNGGRFDYDVVRYHVGAPLPRADFGRVHRTRRFAVVLNAWNVWSAWSPWYYPVYPYDVSGFSVGFDFGTYFPLRAARPVGGWRRR